MIRERVLKVVLVLVGLIFCATVYPLILMVRQEPALAMMMSLYATLAWIIHDFASEKRKGALKD